MSQSVNRAKVLVAMVVLSWVALLAYLGYVQIYCWRQYEKLATRQHGERLSLRAARGRIYEGRGRPLTLGRTSCSIRILPQWARDKDTLAAILAGFGLAEQSAAAQELHRRNCLFGFAREVDCVTGDSLRRVLAERQFSNCTYVEDDNTRVYPYGAACASVVGFVGEERGWTGLESAYDSILRGQEGWVLLLKDAVGRASPHPSFPMKRPLPGLDLHLTLDLDIQQLCYRALGWQVVEGEALKGAVVVLDAGSGAILALADYPCYDPARFRSFARERYRSTAVSDQFEPGSSFKLVVCAAALESPDSTRLTQRSYDVSPGYLEIGGRKINDVHKHGILDFDGLFVKSSNPGCALLSTQLSPERYYELARALGFGNALGVGLPDEGSGWIDPPEHLSELRFANVAFGQGVTVTLLQMAAAYLCVANDGVFLRPYLVESVRRSGRVIHRSGPARLRRAVSPATAGRIKHILEKAVTEGTGTPARIEGVSVCGKTGTAQKVEPWGGYSRTRSRMTFVGFFPKERPRYVVAVLIDEPKRIRFAGAAAGPVFRQIGEDLLLLERMRSRGESRTGVLSHRMRKEERGTRKEERGRRNEEG